jgi:hypothetical protein
MLAKLKQTMIQCYTDCVSEANPLYALTWYEESASSIICCQRRETPIYDDKLVEGEGVMLERVAVNNGIHCLLFLLRLPDVSETFDRGKG